ncbi:MAG: HAD-IIIA family hydrolase [Hahellaceae bacterium]|nr:HAD-IIIA family hydrolase [Hahellaceae bacterium]MCP5169040.1 HAD-IIIA family hydrolase [Hahellaceae bacterium]
MPHRGVSPHFIPEAIRHKARQIKILVLDVDGVLTDGKLYFSSEGDELKSFDITDGLGLKLLRSTGVEVAIITGRTSALVARRARDLGIVHLTQGREDKLVALQELLSNLNLTLDQVAYIGDDLPDLSAICSVGLGITVASGDDFVKAHAAWCTEKSGGAGAVREVCELLMACQETLHAVHQNYLNVGK